MIRAAISAPAGLLVSQGDSHSYALLHRRRLCDIPHRNRHLDRQGRAMSEQIVTVDIGGTHARFAIAEIEGGRVVSLGEATTLHTRDHASFQTAWQDFERQQGGALPRAVAIAIAGPTRGDIIRFTNNPWIIRPALVNEKLGVDGNILVNDFEAVGYAVAQADTRYFERLAGPDEPLPKAGTITVIGPGTGLGVAHVWRGGGQYRVPIGRAHV